MTEKFWADSKAEEIAGRKSYHYIKKEIPEFKVYVVKTSASLSGVLHIGRLSDTIRGESACLALKAQGYESKLIWVAEDMDPLRKVPKNVPQSYAEHIGMPVSDIPDPWGCHESYAKHHIEEYLKVLHEFLKTELEIYSMREEYKKGSFRKSIKLMQEKVEEVKEIQNKYREKKLADNWYPWLPVCKNCGKIITPKIEKVDSGKIHYRCADYQFETTTAKGCNYEGTADPLKDDGKLLWKGEWAAQWEFWKVASEGAGKEYVVPNSAFWVNGELCERILDFPMPVPIFYEHLMIDGEKMSASLGNIIYPKDWLEVAPPDLLRYLYNKKLMKTRSFSWEALPMLYDEYDRVAAKIKTSGISESDKRLFETSNMHNIALDIPFSLIAFFSGIYDDKEMILQTLKKTGHYNESEKEKIMKRIEYAAVWAEKHAKALPKILENTAQIKEKITPGMRKFLKAFANFLEEKERSAEEIQNSIYRISTEAGISSKEAFEAVYLSLLGQSQGPRAGVLIAALDRNFVVKRFKEV